MRLYYWLHSLPGWLNHKIHISTIELDISGLQLAQPGKLQTTKGKIIVLLAQAKLQTLITPSLSEVLTWRR
ncbi:hypothetical protein [Allocoleopsis franciscana]|uniref:Uncharacterized protein n=1 Tax=Allocoleopsis franciscana PCC 7113 TaxID=1173027 RepID=K9WDB4_9CYAN|nr:hypothetical protein [Allocoleopsis franciscana]AFZ17739.1 hypothetical protein Mic7113_1883 [Allocoleopsis franciscana PCC 7113]